MRVYHFYLSLTYGNGIEWPPVQSVIARVINKLKLNDREARVRFV